MRWLILPLILQILGGNLLGRIWEFLHTMNSDYREYLLKRDEREKLMWQAMDRAQLIISEQRNRIASLEAKLAEQSTGVRISQQDYDDLVRKETDAISQLNLRLQQL